MNIFNFDHPAPDYRLVVNGIDITPRIRGCLVELTITDNRHLEADTLDLTLCTANLKVKAGEAYMRSLGFDSWDNLP